MYLGVLSIVLLLPVCFVQGLGKHPLSACPALPNHIPADVNDLHPNNIKVVMALGDSITAAFGVNGRGGGITEVRGVSWSMGADVGAVTLPNLLKYYSPNITGGSTGEHLVEFCYGPVCPPYQYRPGDNLNAAQSGAMVSDLVTHELDHLIEALKNNPNVNMEKDWKLLTMFIGANDLCASCTFDAPLLDPAEYEKHLMTTLKNVYAKVPRVLVQIMEMFNLSQVYNLSLKNKTCATIHRETFIECDCVFRADGAKLRAEVDKTVQGYNAKARSVAAYFQSLKDPAFNVIVHPAGRDTKLADFPIDVLSTYDCFHPSRMMHQIMAINLWNSMLTPAAKRLTSLQLDVVPLCPNATTLLYTN